MPENGGYSSHKMGGSPYPGGRGQQIFHVEQRFLPDHAALLSHLGGHQKTAARHLKTDTSQQFHLTAPSHHSSMYHFRHELSIQQKNAVLKE